MAKSKALRQAAYAKIYPPIGIARVGDSEDQQRVSRCAVGGVSGDLSPTGRQICVCTSRVDQKTGANRLSAKATCLFRSEDRWVSEPF